MECSLQVTFKEDTKESEELSMSWETLRKLAPPPGVLSLPQAAQTTDILKQGSLLAPGLLVPPQSTQRAFA